MKSKRIASVLTAAVMMTALFGGTVPAEIMQNIAVTASAETYAELGLTYLVMDGAVLIFEYTDDLPAVLEIPAEIDGMPVTSIGGSAFEDCTSLTKITIPESVTSIGGYAFYDTPWLAAKREESSLIVVNSILIDGITCSGDIVIPESVTSIGDWAFSDCTSLTNITIPNSVTSIRDYAFSYCTSLTEMTIPASVKIFGKYAFHGCPNLTIKGYTGSCAETYATENNIPFESIGITQKTGDLTGDGDVSVADAVLLARCIAQNDTLESEETAGFHLAVADLNGDGILNILDIRLLLIRIAS